MIAPAGLTLYRVVTRKHAGRLHVAVDGGMGDNLEHSLYGQRFSPAGGRPVGRAVRSSPTWSAGTARRAT